MVTSRPSSHFFGFRIRTASMMSMQMPSTRSKTASGRSITRKAPTMAPKRAGMANCRLARNSEAPLLRNPSAPATAPIRMPRRLLALATAIGRPIKSSAARVRNEPPPASVLIMPETKPAAMSRAACARVISIIAPVKGPNTRHSIQGGFRLATLAPHRPCLPLTAVWLPV